MSKKKRQSRRVRLENKIRFKFFVLAMLIVLLSAVAAYINHQDNWFFPKTRETEVTTLPPEAKKLLLSASTSSLMRIPILMYHYVEYVANEKDTIRQSLNITPNVFAKQVETLSSAGYTFITARELGEVFDGKAMLSQKPVLLTFDDGHWDLYTDVLPILKKYNARGTVYVISDYLNGSDFLSTEQLIELSKSGYFEIGSHTVNHAWLKDGNLQNVKYEVVKSKKDLEKILKIPVVSFAYPYGAFDEQAASEVEKAGYKTAVITVPGVMDSAVNRFFLFRLRPGGRVGNELLNYLEETDFNP